MIPAGQDSTLIILSADASLPEGTLASFKIVGRAIIDGKEVLRVANPDERLRIASVIPPPDIVVAAAPRSVVLEPGKEVTFALRVERRNGFRARVPCDILNLPPGVFVENVGLNGVLVNEDETQRVITLRAEDWVRPIEQLIYAVGTVESDSPTEHASVPLRLTLQAKGIAPPETVQATNGP